MPPRSRAEVTPAKLKALREALARDLVVTFKNGAQIRRTEKGGVSVNRWPLGKVVRFERTFPMKALEAAYDYALNGETEAERARRPRSKPFWFDSEKVREPRPEWEECPF